MVKNRYPQVKVEKNPEWAKNPRMKALKYAEAHLILASEFFKMTGLKNERRTVERLLKKIEGIIKDEKKE